MSSDIMNATDTLNATIIFAPSALSAFDVVSNFAYFVALLLFMGTGAVLAGPHIALLLLSVPAYVARTMLYVSFSYIVYMSKFWLPDYSHIIATPCVMAVAVTMLSTLNNFYRQMNKALQDVAKVDPQKDEDEDTDGSSRPPRSRSPNRYEESRKDTKKTRGFQLSEDVRLSIWAGCCTIYFAACAIYLESQTMGYFAAAAFMSMAGFTALFVPGMVSVGYKSSFSVMTGTVASLVTLASGLYLEYLYEATDGFCDSEYLAYAHTLFAPGMLWLGSFVYFISLLIMSSRSYWYSYNISSSQKMVLYFWTQVVTIASCFAAIWYGSLYDVVQVVWCSKIISSFFFLEKLYDLTPDGLGIHMTFFVSAFLIFGNTWIRMWLGI